MTCQDCGTANPATAKFCLECGSNLALACPSCRTELPTNARFCFSCGAQVGVTASTSAPPSTATSGEDDPASEGLRRFIPPELLTKLDFAAKSEGMHGERRTVTMLFCDVQGSTAAAESLDPEEWADIMNGAFEHLIAPVYRYEGTLARLMGDAILAFFGAPIGHEDDPERAVRAALEIIEDFKPYCASVKRDWDVEIDIRVGINTGLVVVGAMGSDLRVEYTAMGDAVNLASRLESTAEPGTVQISDDTMRLVDKLFESQPLGTIQVKGRKQPVPTYRVVRAVAQPETMRGIEGLRAPLVGRDTELDALRSAMDQVSETGRGRVLSIVGEAGLGKSRLLAELRNALDNDASPSWYVGHSMSYETSVPYTPVRRILRAIIGLEGGESDGTTWRHIEALVSSVMPGKVGDTAPFLAWMLDSDVPEEFAHRTGYLQPPQLRTEGFRAALELIEALASKAPLALVFEDLHWADSASIEFVIELLGIVDRSSLALILLFRPRRQEGSWRVHQEAEQNYPHLYTPIALSPLPESDTKNLVAGLLAVDGLSDEVRNLILVKSDGNPFFVEEIIRSMIDGGIVVHDGGRWIATTTAGDFVVPETLSAVLTTRLDGLDERSRSVAQAASVVGRRFRYDELAAALSDVTELDRGLTELQRRDLIREITRIPKRVFEFKHALVQEAAYSTVLLKRRTQLHGAVAEFLISFHPERASTIADHLVESKQTVRAIPYLVAAGEDAGRTYALQVAIDRMGQVLSVMDDATDASLVRRALEVLGQAREYIFDFQGADEAYQRLRDEGERRGDVGMEVSGMNKSGLIRGFFFDERAEALDQLAEAESKAREAGIGAGLVEACTDQCFLRTGYAEFDEVEHYMNEVTALGKELGEDEPTLFGMAHLANTLTYLTRFDEALVQGEKTLAVAEERGNLQYQAEMLTFPIPVCHLRNGDLDSAMAAVERGMEIALRIGARTSEAFAAVFQGKVAMAQGHLEDALALFRRARAAGDATGIPYMQALGLCVTGTCYLQFGGPMVGRALEYHDETLETMDLPTGTTLGAWLWAEMGHCALAANKLDDAKELFRRALTEKTAPMYLERPSALVGSIEVALAEGRIDDARDTQSELDEYVASRDMRNQVAIVRYTAARVEAAAHNHEVALEHLAACEALVADAGMRRFALDVHAARARSLDALGRDEEAAAARGRGQELVEGISSSITDEALHSAFLIGSGMLLEPTGRKTE